MPSLLAYSWLWWGGIPGLNFIINRILPLIVAGVVIFLVAWGGWFLAVKFLGSAYEFGAQTYRNSLKMLFTPKNLIMFFPIIFTACILGGLVVWAFTTH